jgi:hypothetical protein
MRAHVRAYNLSPTPYTLQPGGGGGHLSNQRRAGASEVVSLSCILRIHRDTAPLQQLAPQLAELVDRKGLALPVPFPFREGPATLDPFGQFLQLIDCHRQAKSLFPPVANLRNLGKSHSHL